MASGLTPKGINKGRSEVRAEIAQVSAPVVNESNMTPEQVKELQNSASALYGENRNLREENKRLNKMAETIVPEALQDTKEWKRRALEAESRLESYEDGDLSALRDSRKFELLKVLLQGEAAAGHLFGNGVGQADVNKVVQHCLGVSEIAEAKAFKRRF